MSSKPATPWESYAHSSEMVGRQLGAAGPAGATRAAGGEEEDSLLVALTYRCNSRCRFCIIETELNRFADPSADVLEPLFAENGRSRRFRRLILSGAEVTLRDDLADIAAAATGRGGFSVVRIQTNARRLSDPALAARLFQSGVREYFVSVHAADPAADAHITGIGRSFAELELGVRHLRALGATLCSNTVVCRDNAAALPDIARILIRWGFSGAHLWSFLHLGEVGQEGNLVSLEAAMPPLRAAVAELQAAGVAVTTKWFPRCLLGPAGDTLDNHQPQLLIRDEFQDRLSEGFRFDCVHASACAHFGRGCDGLHAGYVRRFGDERDRLTPTPASPDRAPRPRP